MDWYPTFKPLLHSLPPETAHNLAVFALRKHLIPESHAREYPRLQQTLWKLTFDNPVGLAAGFDKNAEVTDPLLAQGFGFVEAGTCTVYPQKGNPKPRMFRIPKEEAVINRLGFNNKGMDVFSENLRVRQSTGIVGANIGKNKDSTNAINDYTQLLEKVSPFASYITINISSPNTEGLRDLQAKEMLRELCDQLIAMRASISFKRPILIKIAPDLSLKQTRDLAEVALEKAIDGLIVSNTTIERPSILPERFQNEAGGLSGPPVFERSTALLKEIYKFTEGRIPLIGVGGIDSPEAAYAKIRAGASLVQLYTGLIYHGFHLVHRINAGLETFLTEDGFTSIRDAVGVDVH